VEGATGIKVVSPEPQFEEVNSMGGEGSRSGLDEDEEGAHLLAEPWGA
jgi:hypothetical protein